jgi:hypothetical protein
VQSSRQVGELEGYFLHTVLPNRLLDLRYSHSAAAGLSTHLSCAPACEPNSGVDTLSQGRTQSDLMNYYTAG